MKIRLSLALLALLSFTTLPANAEDPSPAPSSAPDGAAQPDFGDYKSSTLTTKAWKALGEGDTALVKAYTHKCIDSFEKQAIDMQKGITGPVSTDDKEAVFKNWALNDVGTCYFILGSALEKSGDKKGALEAYKTLSEKFPDAKCWDTKGWFWTPADAAKGKLKALEFDAIS